MNTNGIFAYQNVNVKIFRLFIFSKQVFCVFHSILLQILIKVICNMLYLLSKIKAEQVI